MKTPNGDGIQACLTALETRSYSDLSNNKACQIGRWCPSNSDASIEYFKRKYRETK